MLSRGSCHANRHEITRDSASVKHIRCIHGNRVTEVIAHFVHFEKSVIHFIANVMKGSIYAICRARFSKFLYGRYWSLFAFCRFQFLGKLLTISITANDRKTNHLIVLARTPRMKEITFTQFHDLIFRHEEAVFFRAFLLNYINWLDVG